MASEVLGLLPRNPLGVLPVQALDTGYQRWVTPHLPPQGPVQNADFWDTPSAKKKKKIALVLRYHLLGFSYRVVRANWASRANPPQSKPLRIVNFIVWFLPLEVVSLFHGNAEYPQKPKGFSFPKTLRLMDFDASTLLFIHLYSLYGFPFGSGD